MPIGTNFGAMFQYAQGQASKYAQSLRGVMDAHVELARQGRGQQEILDLSNNALLMSTVADIPETADSVKFLTAAVAQMGMAVQDANLVLDSWNEVSNRTPAQTIDLANSFMRSAQSAYNAGLEMHDLAGITATLEEVTKRGGAQIGNSLKTIFARQKMDGVSSQLADLGIATRDATGDLRDTMDVFDDVAAKWESLNSLQRSELAESMGGKYHINAVMAMFENYDKVLQYTTISQNSFGSATKELETFQEGLSFKISNLIANLENLAYTIGQSGLHSALTFLIESTTTVITGFTKMTDATHGLNILIPTLSIGVYGLVKAAGALSLALRSVGAAGTFAKMSLGWLGAGLIAVELITSAFIGSASASNQSSAALTEQAAKTNQTANEIERLVDKHDDLKESGLSTKESQEELQSILEQIHALNPELVSSSGEYGQQMDLNKDATDRYVESLRAKNEEELKSALAVENANRIALQGDLAEAQDAYDKFNAKAKGKLAKIEEIEVRFGVTGLKEINAAVDAEVTQIEKTLERLGKEQKDIGQINTLTSELVVLNELKKVL